MNPVFKASVIIAVAAVLCAVTLILVPHFRDRGNDPGGTELAEDDLEQEDELETAAVGRTASASSGSRSSRASSVRTENPSSDREQSKFDVGEMRNEVEEMVRKFRGTPEERQEVIEECEDGKELIRLIADLSVTSIDNMSPEELEKERESFEKEYRAQLDYLQSGQLQRMLKTPEEQEVIGSTIETVQGVLEQLDEALHSAGY